MPCLRHPGDVRATNIRRVGGCLGASLLVLSVFVAPPFSIALFLGALVIAVGLFLFRPREIELAQIAKKNQDPTSLTVFDIAELTGESPKSTATSLDRDGVPRADAKGWKRALPAPITKLRYRRSDIERWLASRGGN